MNCEQVQALLISYLNNETTPSERALIQAHLPGCPACQAEMSLLARVQEQVGSALQRRAADAIPARDAWERLETRLAKAAHPLPAPSKPRLSRLAPGVSRLTTQLFSGGMTMRKKLALSALGAVLIVSMVAISMTKTADPVSAQEILDHAYAVQATNTPTQGIHHLRIETYQNVQALPEGMGTLTLIDNYYDFQNGNVRLVVTDTKTGKVLELFSYDGEYVYSQGNQEDPSATSQTIIYRSPQSRERLADQHAPSGDPQEDLKQMFDQMRSDPNVELVGQESWPDGRSVYILRTQQPAKVLGASRDGTENDSHPPIGTLTMAFDTKTYEQLESRMTIDKDGQEILLTSQRVLVNEILPAGSAIPWHLEDMEGITIVDDPHREHGDLLPEVISEQDLAAKTSSAYLLKTIPEGFALEISAPPRQAAGEPYIYIASYRSPADDYFVIQDDGTIPPRMLGEADEAYTTTDGLALHFIRERADPSGTQYTSAIAEAPSGKLFWISSTLPRETVQAWAEELVLVK